MIIIIEFRLNLEMVAGIEPAKVGLQATVYPFDFTIFKLVEQVGIEPTADCLQNILASLVHAAPLNFILSRDRTYTTALRGRGATSYTMSPHLQFLRCNVSFPRWATQLSITNCS